MSSNAQKTKFLKGRFAGGEKKSRHAMEEFSHKKEFIFCPHNEAVYYKKAWHSTADFFERPLNFKKEKNIKFKLCPAHEMAKNKQYEGEILIENILPKFRKDIFNLIGNMDKAAQRIDILDRVLGVKITNNGIRVLTSENQLAQKIARKIASTFKNRIHMNTRRGKDADVVSIKIVFIKQ